MLQGWDVPLVWVRWLCLPSVDRKLWTCLWDPKGQIVQVLWAIRNPSWSAMSDLWGPVSTLQHDRQADWLPKFAWKSLIFIRLYSKTGVISPPAPLLVLLVFKTSFGTRYPVSTGSRGHLCLFFIKEQHTWRYNFAKASLMWWTHCLGVFQQIGH